MAEFISKHQSTLKIISCVSIVFIIISIFIFAGSLIMYPGKSSLGIIAFFLSWGILNNMWKDKETNFNRIAIVSIALVAVGLIFTFPPVWHLLLGGE